VMTAISGMVLYLAFTPAAWNGLAARPEALTIWLVGILNLLLLAWKHRADLRQPPRLRRRSSTQ